MKTILRFEGFSPGFFGFFRELDQNNSRDWFEGNRRRYESTVLATIRAFVSELGQILRILNPELETEPRVGRTISRIANGVRLFKDRPPYRPFIYVSYPREGRKRSEDARLYAGLSPRGVSIGFYPGRRRPLRTGPIQESIRVNQRAFQRYLNERRIPDKYWELSGGENGVVRKWPLPKTARRWVDLESFTVGEYFDADDAVLGRRGFLDRAQTVLIDLYPLWLFATSSDLRKDLGLYHEKAIPLAQPLTKCIRSADDRRKQPSGARKPATRSVGSER